MFPYELCEEREQGFGCTARSRHSTATRCTNLVTLYADVTLFCESRDRLSTPPLTRLMGMRTYQVHHNACDIRQLVIALLKCLHTDL